MALLGPPMPAAGRDTAPAKAFLEGAVGIARKAWPKPLEFQPRQAPRESLTVRTRALTAARGPLPQLSRSFRARRCRPWEPRCTQTFGENLCHRDPKIRLRQSNRGLLALPTWKASTASPHGNRP